MDLYRKKPPDNEWMSRATRSARKITAPEHGKEAADIIIAVKQLPEIRENRVQAVKKAIESGCYRVDPREVAEAILKEL